jgi:hypothetical protein
MQVKTTSGGTVPPQRRNPQFGAKTQIVLDPPPAIKTGMPRVPNLRVGVPADEEPRIGNRPGFSRAFFLGNLHYLFNKFF